MRTKKPCYLSVDETNQLLASLKNQRNKVMVLLIIDCGLRAAECVVLKYSNFDFNTKTLYIKPYRGKTDNFTRAIPISARLFRELGNYIYSKSSPAITDKDAWIFPSKNPSGHVHRSSIHYMIHKANSTVAIKELYSSTLRHTFAAQHLYAGSTVEDIGQMLGYSRRKRMLGYIQIPPDELRANIEKVTNRKTRWQKLLATSPLKRWFQKPVRAINIDFNEGGAVTVGRNEIIEQLNDLVARKINTVIMGGIGVGKSHLLDSFEEAAKDSSVIKILKMDDTAELKSTLAQMLIYILKTDQQGVYEYLFPGYDHAQAVTKVSRENTLHIAKEIVKLTEKKFYTLVIDNVDQISPRAVKILELFKDHFTIITTARVIPVNRSSFIWNFEVIRLQPLKREFAMQLIQSLSGGLKPEDLWLYKNHVYEQTNGNPRAIHEIIERYRKEPVLSNDVIRRIRHTGALPEYDCTFLVLLFLACVACLRYLNHEVQNASFRVLGGIALVLLFITRYFFKASRKTNV